MLQRHKSPTTMVGKLSLNEAALLLGLGTSKFFRHEGQMPTV